MNNETTNDTDRPLGHRLRSVLPDNLNVESNGLMWALLGTAHGAIIIAHTDVPETYFIWCAILLAASAQIAQ